MPQLGQKWFTSLRPSTQRGMRQHLNDRERERETQTHIYTGHRLQCHYQEDMAHTYSIIHTNTSTTLTLCIYTNLHIHTHNTHTHTHTCTHARTRTHTTHGHIPSTKSIPTISQVKRPAEKTVRVTMSCWHVLHLSCTGASVNLTLRTVTTYTYSTEQLSSF